jgi:rhodanese-related sulfurtransferase
MTIASIDAPKAARLLSRGALLVDVRESDERRARIPGSLHVPLARLPERLGEGAPAVIFHCRSGMRCDANAARLAATIAPDVPAYTIEGGLDAWARAGLGIETDRRPPIEVMRQVQIVAGSLVLLGVLFGTLVAPAFLALSAFVGAGLVFAGASGWCGMALLLRRMPWNRRTAAA